MQKNVINILGRGCDPVRAAFAKKQFEPILNCIIDTATSDEELIQYLKSGKTYKVFFFAPGQCSLIKQGFIDGEAVIQIVKKHQPGVQILKIESVEDLIPMISKAIGLSNIPNIKPLTQDWPFID